MQLKAQERKDLQKLARTSPALAKKLIATLSLKKTAEVDNDVRDAIDEITGSWSDMGDFYSVVNKSMQKSSSHQEIKQAMLNIQRLYKELDDLILELEEMQYDN